MVGGLTAAAVAGLHARASTGPAETQAATQAGTTGTGAVQAPRARRRRPPGPSRPPPRPPPEQHDDATHNHVRAATSTTLAAAGPAPPQTFDATRAMAHVKQLAVGLGVRTGARKARRPQPATPPTTSRDWLLVDILPVALPNGRVSHNVKAVKAGASSATVLLGAHLDSEAPSPGANDNASGVATVLELARDLRDADTVATVELVLFGTEEIIDTVRDHDHYGSRAFVKTMTPTERGNLAGMISVDMVSSGDILTVGTMGRGPQGLSDLLQAYARGLGLPVQYDQDTSSYGQGDYEPFELRASPPRGGMGRRPQPTTPPATPTSIATPPSFARRARCSSASSLDWTRSSWRRCARQARRCAGQQSLADAVHEHSGVKGFSSKSTPSSRRPSCTIASRAYPDM